MSPEEGELVALLQLRLLPRVGDRVTDRLLRRFGSAREALDASDATLRELAGPAAVRARRRSLGEAGRRARRILSEARETGTAVVARGLPGYPARLLDLADPPPVLFLRGRSELLRARSVAVVGTRRATGAGRRFAGALGRVLARGGVPVVSGLALGIDAAAHRGALDGASSTVAVLGSGIDRCHPSSHRRLQDRIGREGLLVSEFLPGEGASPHHFPRRNRILAALARAVVVVEAGVRSGALITVDHALDLGREIFAVPGSVELPQAKGTNGLLRDGAHALPRPEGLLEWWDRKVGARDPETARDGSGDRPTDPEETTSRRERVSDPDGLLPFLETRPLPLDRLAQRVQLAPARLLQALSELELQGGAIREPEGWRSALPADDPEPARRPIRQDP